MCIRDSLLPEREVYVEDSYENKVWEFYHEQTRDPILAYAVAKAIPSVPFIQKEWNQSTNSSREETVSLIS